jgi:predicted glycoside hydrolase/deacetylase ChbG (UPF0249 family)
VIIVNADDWGRSRVETDAALTCYRAARITSVSAMVFMADSARASELAREAGIDVGLHINLTQRFSGEARFAPLADRLDRIARFLGAHRYASLIYNPALREQFRYVYQAQFDEFVRLYGKAPSHLNGHHHQHLCANMLFDHVIPAGAKVRRSFHFWPGEKGLMNRSYRRFVNSWLARRYSLTDFFFALAHCLAGDRMARVAELARTTRVEVMTHPVDPLEHDYLMSDRYVSAIDGLERGTYSSL